MPSPKKKKDPVPIEILRVFTGSDSKKLRILSMGGGLINHSFKVTVPGKPALFLQQINKEVFTRPQDVQENYMHIWEYLAKTGSATRIPVPVMGAGKQSLYTDTKGQYWRAFAFIPGTVMRHVADSPAKARAVARSFAALTAALAGMDTRSLHPVIPRFHDLGWRYQQFEEALQGKNQEQLSQAGPTIKALKDRVAYRDFYEEIARSAAYPKRVMHHDAKISNILFSAKSGRVVCPVDLDTVMPGYFFSDLGDMIRSMVCRLEEDQHPLPAVRIRGSYYKAILEGYLSEKGIGLTGAEKKHIHYAGPLMIYMQALRFLTDYINGEKYYKTSYPGQNLHRAQNQLQLLEQLERFLKKLYNFRYA